MTINTLDDDNIDELFFESNCIDINPSQLRNEAHTKSKNPLSIININIRSLSKNFNLLLTLLTLSKTQYTFIVITETWLHDFDDTLFSIPDYEHISLNRKQNKKGGGVRIYFHKSIKFLNIDTKLTGLHDSHESLAAVFSMDAKYIINIIGIYRPPKNNVSSFIKYIKSKKLAQNNFSPNEIKIVAGDMNIPYNVNFSNIPRNHQEYFELFTSNSFKFHITKPTRLGRIGTNDTVIDHIWSNCFFDSFAFSINYKISDHIPRAVVFDHDIPLQLRKVKFFNFSLDNTNKFIPKIPTVFEPLVDYSFRIVNTEESTNHIFSEILKIAKKYFPVKTQQISDKRQKSPWLKKNMIKCLRIKHKLFELYKNKVIQYGVFRSFSNNIRNIINRSKTIYERNILNELSGNTRGIWKKINSLMRPNEKSEPPFIIDTKKVTHTDSNKISDALIKHFDSEPINLIKDIPKYSSNYTDKIEMNKKSMVLYPATQNEIISIIKDLKNNNNVNDIPTKLLKLAHQEVSLILANLFNAIIEQGFYPELLKHAVLTAVYKKGSKTDIKNYRPISVLKIIDKIFEKLLYVRLESFFQKCQLFSVNQFGFTKGKDTGIAVTKLIHEITVNLDNNNYSLCIFADLSKAFDTVNHSLLMKKLYRYGVRGNAYNLLESFLTNRLQQVKFKQSLSKTYTIRSGVPQGSCLGPLLYNIYTIDIENAIKTANITMYADDITFEISGNDPIELQNKANSLLKTFQDYCFHNYFSISVIKTVYMIFAKNPSNTNQPTVTINLSNTPLKKVDSVCYLGVLIDEKLKFTKQADEIRNKLNMYKSISRKINNKVTFIPSKIFYFSLVQSRILYGLPVWGGALFVNEACKDLQDKQDKIIRALFSKFFPRKSLRDIYSELRIPTIKQLYKIYCSFYFYDILNTNKFPQIKSSTVELLFNHQYNTRKNSLIIPLNNFSNFRFTFLYNAVKVWNEIPGSNKNTENPKIFRSMMKKFFTSD